MRLRCSSSFYVTVIHNENGLVSLSQSHAGQECMKTAHCMNQVNLRDGLHILSRTPLQVMEQTELAGRIHFKYEAAH